MSFLPPSGSFIASPQYYEPVAQQQAPYGGFSAYSYAPQASYGAPPRTGSFTSNSYAAGAYSALYGGPPSYGSSAITYGADPYSAAPQASYTYNAAPRTSSFTAYPQAAATSGSFTSYPTMDNPYYSQMGATAYGGYTGAGSYAGYTGGATAYAGYNGGGGGGYGMAPSGSFIADPGYSSLAAGLPGGMAPGSNFAGVPQFQFFPETNGGQTGPSVTAAQLSSGQYHQTASSAGASNMNVGSGMMSGEHAPPNASAASVTGAHAKPSSTYPAAGPSAHKSSVSKASKAKASKKKKTGCC